MAVATRARIPVGTPFLLRHHFQSLIPVGVVGNIRACHARARGSIPRSGAHFAVARKEDSNHLVANKPFTLTPNKSKIITLDPLWGASEKIGTIQRRLAWPLRKDDTHKSRMYHFFLEPTIALSVFPIGGVIIQHNYVHTWMGASSDQPDSSPSGKLLHCTPEFNEPLRGSHCGLPTFSFLSERCGVRAHL